MNEKIIVVEEESIEGNGPTSLSESSGRLLLAGIGALVVLQGEARTIANRLIERGEGALQRSRKRLSRSDRPGQRSLRRRIGDRAERALARMNVPTRSDIDALNEQITSLLVKVEQLEQQAEMADFAQPETQAEF